MTFGISHLLALTVLIASAIALGLGSSTEIRWSKEPLIFSPPTVPDKFKRTGVNPILHLPSLPIEFESGEQLYSAHYRNAWESCRQQFYDGKRDWRQRASRLSPGFKVEDPWGWDHCWFAADAGYIECTRQISRLLESRSERELRRELVQSNIFWYTSLVACIGCVSWLILSTLLRRSR